MERGEMNLIWPFYFNLDLCEEVILNNGGVSGNYQVFVDLLCSLKNEVRAK